MKKLGLLMLLCVYAAGLKALNVVVPDVWINEVHYNNMGTDTLEGFEIAGPMGENLGCYQVMLYDGSNGQVYSSITLSGTIPGQQAGYGTVWFGLTQGSIQNTSNIGIALVYAPQATSCGVANVDTVLQFLSFGGQFIAANGRVQGFTSQDIPVTENSLTTIGTTIQLGGTGMKYSDFSWQSSLASTHDSPNTNQTFVTADPEINFILSSFNVSENAGTFQLAISITNYNANQTSVDVNVVPGGTAQAGVNFTYSPPTINFPGSSQYNQLVTVTIIDNQIPDGNKSFTLKLAYPTNNATIGSSAQCTINIIDDDTLKVRLQNTSVQQTEDISPVLVPVELTGANNDTTTVQLKLIQAGTTAIAGVDYNFSDTTLTWPTGTTGVINVPITVINNPFYEPARTVQVGLFNVSSGVFLGDSLFTLVIQANNNQVACSDLFFSQYVDGSANNKAVQIYNPTQSTIDLSQYQILQCINGGPTTSVFNLSGMLQPGHVYVAANSAAGSAVLGAANSTSGFFNFDGNDALALIHNTDTIDIIGELRVDPGANGWAVDTGTTVNHTLIRSRYFYNGDVNWSSAVRGWKAYPNDMFDSLSSHHIAPCGTIEPATIQFIGSADTVLDTAVVMIRMVVNNPSNNQIQFKVVRDDPRSTAVFGTDWGFTSRLFANYGGISYDTLYVPVYQTPYVQPTKKGGLKFIDVLNAIVIPDSLYTIYMENDNKYVVSFLGAGISYVKDTNLVEVKVTVSTFAPFPISATVTLAPGSAIYGQDFTFTDTTVTFPAYSIDTQGVWVNLIPNNINGENRQINFNLSNNTTNTVLGISGYTLTIINFDTTAYGIQEVAVDQLGSVYPNPTNNILSIQCRKEIELTSVTNAVGEILIQPRKLVVGVNTLDVEQLPVGLYFINIKTPAGVISRKFIKQ